MFRVLAFGIAIGVTGAAFLLPSYWLFLATSAAIGVIVARSAGLVTGQAGMISLCQLSFAAAGAWVVAWLSLGEATMPFPIRILIGGLAAVPFGVLVGLPALRLRGVNLAIITLGFAAAADLYFQVQGFPKNSFTAAVVPPPPFDSDLVYFEFCWGMVVIISLLLGWADRARMGAAWLAVRHSERATAAMGMNVPLVKLTAFATSAFIAGLSGGLLAGQVGLVTPQNFAPLGSLVVFALAVMMGAQHVEGALLAGLLIALFPELLRKLGLPPDVADLLFAIGTIDVLRRGRGGVATQIREALRIRRAKRLAAPASGARIDEHRIAPALVHTGQHQHGSSPALDIRGLTVRFGEVIALDGVGLRLEHATVGALIGPNGAGKTTLVDAVTGFLHGYEGYILAAGVSLDQLPAHRRARAGVRRTFQQGRTIPDLNVGQYVRLAAGRTLGDSELSLLLDFFDCPASAQPIASLDVGTRRLVEVAGALAARPAVLLLDEPAAGLAETASIRLANRIAEIPHHYGCSVLLIEHDMGHVVAASSEVTVLDFGRVIANGPTRDVLEHPVVIAAYLGEEVSA
ncbi:MAG: branched-chain amino acid ABC transporter ATP-binding protein/permease [Betaproteobacteria bacterium]|nr:branched-chain amino acid ABC transporter ATP-binding protein/permease [Betaproteobacteria bacterium]